MSNHSESPPDSSSFAPEQEGTQVNSSSSPAFDPEAPPYRQGNRQQGLLDQFNSPISPPKPTYHRSSFFPHGEASQHQQQPSLPHLRPSTLSKQLGLQQQAEEPLPKFGDPTRAWIPKSTANQDHRPDPTRQETTKDLTRALRKVQLSNPISNPIPDPNIRYNPNATLPRSKGSLNLLATPENNGKFKLKSQSPESINQDWTEEPLEQVSESPEDSPSRSPQESLGISHLQLSPTARPQQQTTKPTKMTDLSGISGSSQLSLLLAGNLEKFTNAPKQKAKKWLKELTFRLEDLGIDDPKKKIRHFGIYTDVDDWIENNGKVKTIIDHDNPTEDDWDDLCKAFLIRFSKDTQPTRNPLDRIGELEQGTDDLWEYYTSGSELLSQAAVEDDEDATGSKKFTLETVCDKWVDGLNDDDVALACFNMPEVAAGKTRTLRSLYNKAVAAERGLKKGGARADKKRKEEELSLRTEYMEKMARGERIDDELANKMQRVLNFTVPRPGPERVQSAPPYQAAPIQNQTVSAFQNQRGGYSNYQPRGMFAAAGSSRRPPSPQQQMPAQARQMGRPPTPESARMNPWELARDNTQQYHPTWDPSHSLNPFVNGSMEYRYRPDNQLCHSCGNTGHRKDECQDMSKHIGKAEQSFLSSLTRYQVEKSRLINEARGRAAEVPIEAAARLVSVTSSDSARSTPSTKSYPALGVWQDMRAGLVESNAITAEVFLDEAEPGNKRGAEEPDQTNRSSNTEADKRARTDNLRCNHQLQDSPDPECVAGKCEHLCCGPGARTLKALKKTRVPPSKKPAPQIIGKIGEPHKSLKDLLQGVNIVLPLLEFAQWAPAARTDLKRLVSLPTKKRVKKSKVVVDVSRVTVDKSKKHQGKRPAQNKRSKEDAPRRTELEFPPEVELDEGILKSIDTFAKADRSQRAFGMAAKVWKQAAKQMLVMPPNNTVADSGSDINLFYPGFMRKLGLETHPCHTANLPEMRMTMADHSVVDLKTVAVAYVMIEGIIRKVWAFVCPTESSRGGDAISMLLGMPYLVEVKAVIDTASRSITIGNEEEGRVTVQGGRQAEPSLTKVEVLNPVPTTEEAPQVTFGENEESGEEYDDESGEEYDDGSEDQYEEASQESEEDSRGSEQDF